MAGTQVQQKIAPINSAGTTASATFDSTCTSGNLLLAYLTVDKSSGAITVPTGFTLVHDYVGASVSVAMAYKFSNGTETTITWSHATSRSMKQVQILEYSGLDTFDVKAEADSANVSVTSQTTGTTATTASTSARAFALVGSDSKGSTDAGAAWTNSFTSTYTDPGGIDTGCSGLYSSEKDLSATGTQETTFSTTGTGDQMAGMIAVFYQSGGVTGTIGIAEETDTVLALSVSKKKAIGIAEETDSALALVLGLRVAIGLAEETDSVLGMGRSKVRSVELAEETDAALSLSIRKTVALGVAEETDSAQELTRAKAKQIGFVEETDSVIGITASKIITLGIAEETSTVHALSSSRSLEIGIATENDWAIPLVPASTAAVRERATIKIHVGLAL